MIVYQLHRAPAEHAGEGEDWDIYFTSLREAKKQRRREISDTLDGIRYDEEHGRHVLDRGGPDFQIDRLVLARASPRKLILRVLNKLGYIAQRTTVVPPWSAP